MLTATERTALRRGEPINPVRCPNCDEPKVESFEPLRCIAKGCDQRFCGDCSECCEYCAAPTCDEHLSEGQEFIGRDGKPFISRICPECKVADDASAAEERARVTALRPELEAILAKLDTADSDEVSEALQRMSLEVLAA